MSRRVFEPLQPDSFVNVNVVEQSSIPPNASPYAYDAARTGFSLHAGWEIMYHASQPGALEELVMINTNSGQRIKLELEPQTRRYADSIEWSANDVVDRPGYFYIPAIGNGLTWKCIDGQEHRADPDQVYLKIDRMVWVRIRAYLDGPTVDKIIEEYTGTRNQRNAAWEKEVAHIRKVFNLPVDAGPAPHVPGKMTARTFGLDE